MQCLDTSGLHLAHQVDKLVAHEDRITTEKEGQEQPGANSPHELRPGHKHKSQDGEARQQHFGHRERRCTDADDRRHDRIHFNRTKIEQLQRKKCVEAAK